MPLQKLIKSLNNFTEVISFMIVLCQQAKTATLPPGDRAELIERNLDSAQKEKKRKKLDSFFGKYLKIKSKFG